MDIQEEKPFEQEPRKEKQFSIARVLILLFIILSIPAFLLLPALSRAREGARRAKCTSNLKQIGLGIKQYALDNNEFLPFVYGDKEPYQAFGKLHPAYASALEVFLCPSSRDRKWDAKVDHVRNGAPFSQESCKRSLSYAYGHNRGKPWTEGASGATRIAADKYATQDYSTNIKNRKKPLNHIRKITNYKAPGRFYVRLDGSAEQDENLVPLETDPDFTYEKSGHPESDQTGADWWSDPPDKR
jgi:competence protein ComGC